MNLVEKGIEPYARGVVAVSEDEGGVRLSRMTQPLLDYYAKADGLAIRSRCNAGVSIEFVTDSPTVDVEFDYLEGARNYYGLDVEVDGVQTFGMRIEEVADTSLALRVVDAGGGEMRRVRIFLGPCKEVRLRRVTLADGATVEATLRPPFRLLALGDSITQGMCALSACSPYPTRLARLIEADLVNQAVGGHVFDPQAVDLESSIDPGLVTVAYGTNDWNGGAGEGIGDIVVAYLERLRASLPDPPIVVISPIWRTDAGESRGGVSFGAFSRQILDSAARVEGVIPVEGAGLVPHQPYYFSDGLHPNDTGFLHYAMNLYRVLRDSGTLAGSH